MLEQGTWVAMPAWSVPGSHSVGRPRMRWYRAMQSCSVTNMACPMCSLPVTLGGGLRGCTRERLLTSVVAGAQTVGCRFRGLRGGAARQQGSAHRHDEGRLRRLICWPEEATVLPPAAVLSAGVAVRSCLQEACARALVCAPSVQALLALLGVKGLGQLLGLLLGCGRWRSCSRPAQLCSA